MSDKNQLNGADKAFIQEYAGKITVKQIAGQRKKNEAAIYAFCYKHGIDFKKAVKPKHKGPYRQLTKNIIPYSTFEPPKKSFSRPPAIYTNRSPFGIANN